MTTLATLNRLRPLQQVLGLTCPSCHAQPRYRCTSKSLPGNCPRRWEALRLLRADLAFHQLGGVFHTGVACSHCRAEVGEACNSRSPAHPTRVQRSVQAATRLANNFDRKVA